MTHLEGMQVPGPNSKHILGPEWVFASFSQEMSILVACHETKKNIILERNAHFCLELKYIFIWEYLLEISKQINEQKMVRVKEKPFYRHLFMSIFCLVSKHYPSFMVYTSG